VIRGRADGRSPWLRAVDAAVRGIPRGSTASYGQVALFAGRPGAARAVVRALNVLEGIPWWRVIRSDGTLAPPVRVEQAARLAKEGVKVAGGRVADSARLNRRRRSTGTTRPRQDAPGGLKSAPAR
jgi:methylated-DNA-protein-cysteine methyltransferase related protein